jgi:hypothetical protein
LRPGRRRRWWGMQLCPETSDLNSLPLYFILFIIILSQMTSKRMNDGSEV